MNEIINTFLLAEDKFLPEMRLRQPRLVLVGHLLKPKNKYKNLKKQVIQGKVLRYKAFNIVKNPSLLLHVQKNLLVLLLTQGQLILKTNNQKFIHHIMKENQLLLKGLLELQRIKSTNILLQLEKMYALISQKTQLINTAIHIIEESK